MELWRMELSRIKLRKLTSIQKDTFTTFNATFNVSVYYGTNF